MQARTMMKLLAATAIAVTGAALAGIIAIL
jgi:hypothetical protein